MSAGLQQQQQKVTLECQMEGMHVDTLAVSPARVGHWVKCCEIPNTSDRLRNVVLKTQINQTHKTTTETDSSEVVNRLTNFGSLHDGCWFWRTFISNTWRQLPTDSVKHRQTRANIYKEWNALRHSHINKLKDANIRKPQSRHSLTLSNCSNS